MLFWIVENKMIFCYHAWIKLFCTKCYVGIFCFIYDTKYGDIMLCKFEYLNKKHHSGLFGPCQQDIIVDYSALLTGYNSWSLHFMVGM